MTTNWIDDGFELAAGQVTFYLTTGNIKGVESDLGVDSTGQVRPNTTPCP